MSIIGTSWEFVPVLSGPVGGLSVESWRLVGGITSRRHSSRRKVLRTSQGIQSIFDSS